MKRSFGGTASGNLPVPLRVEWTRQSDTDLTKLGKRDRLRVEGAVQRFVDSGHGDVEKLRGRASLRYRLKVGKWRVMFRREAGVIHVHRVLHRREAYRKSSWIGHEMPVQEGLNDTRDHQGSARAGPLSTSDAN